MATVCYLRISTGYQDLEKNKLDIEKFVRDKNLEAVSWVEDIVSGTCNYKNRKLGSVIETMQNGDILIVSELSRLARSITQIFEILNIVRQKGIILYSLKENFCSDDDSISSTIISTVFSLVAQIERSLISERTKEALRAKKAQGIKLGRPVGKSDSKLDAFKEEILLELEAGMSKIALAKKYNISTQALYNWLKRIN